MADATTVRGGGIGGEKPPSGGSRFASGFIAPFKNGASTAGDLGQFIGRTLVECRGVWRYSAEILRQIGILIVGSAAVIWFMEFVMGMQCGLEANYVLRGYGATVYSGVFTAYCATRECVPYMWGYILAAKVGCGLVAEIGSMRINDELDAMDTMGLNPMRYVVATRFVAALLAFPLIYLVGLGFHYLANFIIIIITIGEVSQAGWETIHWAFIIPQDIVYSLAKGMVSGLVIVLVAMYYGYNAKGGPVGVGTATARSMILNLILIHVIGAVMTLWFWGLDPKAPVGG